MPQVSSYNWDYNINNFLLLYSLRMLGSSHYYTQLTQTMKSETTEICSHKCLEIRVWVRPSYALWSSPGGIQCFASPEVGCDLPMSWSWRHFTPFSASALAWHWLLFSVSISSLTIGFKPPPPQVIQDIVNSRSLHESAKTCCPN